MGSVLGGAAIQCDKCGYVFVITKERMGTVEDGDLKADYLTCPSCKARYLYFASDEEMRELVQERRRIADMIRAGQAKGYKQKTLRRYIRIMDKVKAKQKEIYPALKVRGEQLLEKHREVLKEDAGDTLT